MAETNRFLLLAGVSRSGKSKLKKLLGARGFRPSVVRAKDLTSANQMKGDTILLAEPGGQPGMRAEIIQFLPSERVFVLLETN